MEPIAIIGSACRLPGGVDSPTKLWELLSNPQDVSCTIPSSRFSKEKFHHQNPSQHGQTRVSRSYFLSQDVSHFDAEFFGIKPIEAKAIDPQQRMLLEVVYEALESAGIPMESLEGSKTAVYVGAMSADYETTLLRDPESMATYTITGIARSMLANRISYVFDLRGPSMTIDTACSASIVAIHQAVQELRSGAGSELAIAAGSNLLLRPEPFIAGSKINMLSPSGHSKMWDSEADGYARGDGIGILVLKPLRAALRDGDHIESVILETGLNHDGRTKGITMPSASAQTSLIRQTYERAGLDLSIPEDRCQYFEAHGTGTQAGDPIEAEAILSAFFPPKRESTWATNKAAIEAPNKRTIGINNSISNGSATGTPTGTTNGILNTVANGISKTTFNDGSREHFYVGSIKTLVGHTEGTAGIAGVLKASLAMQHGYIPPNLHFVKLNPKVLPFYEGHIQIPTSLIPWPDVGSDKERRASVNSFGFGGTNGHVLLESFGHKSPDNNRTTIEERGDISSLYGPIVISAATGRSLRLNIEALHAFLQCHPNLSLQDLAWTTQCRRSCLPYRASFSGTSISAVTNKLGIALSASPDISETPSRRRIAQPRVLAIFTGQGAQWPQMGRDLILNSSFVSERLDRLDKRLQSLPLSDRPSWTLRSELLADKTTSRMDEAAIAQPLTTALEIVLWDLLCAAAVDTSVSAIVGHSGGETAAAYASGYISAEDAICISYYRGLHSKLARDPITGRRGAMIAVESTVEDAETLVKLPHLVGKVCIAAYNSPESITLAGNEDAILSIKEAFEAKKKFVRLIKVDNAYHSHHMLSCSGALLKSLKALDIKVTPTAKSKWFSSVISHDTGHDLPELLRGEYWNENMVGPVRFSQAVFRAVESDGFDMAIEIGPHPALKGPTLKTLGQVNETYTKLPYAGLLQRGRSDVESFSDALGLVWKHLGPQAVNFAKFGQVLGNNMKPRLLKNLPAYQWSHESYWHESRLSQEYRTNKSPQNELLGSVQPVMVAGQFLWRNFLRLKELPWLSHHSIQGQIVFPAAAYVSMAVDATTAVEISRPPQLIELLDLKILQALIIGDDDTGTEITFALTRVSKSKEFWEAEFIVSAALDRQKLVLVATGRLKVTHGTCDIIQSSDGPDGLQSLKSELFYSTMEHVGYCYTGPFRALSSLRANHSRAAGDILNLTSPAGNDTGAFVAVLDAALQSNFLPSYRSGAGRLGTMPVLTGIKMLRIVPRLWSAGYSKLSFNYFACQDSAEDEVAGDLEIYEPNTTSTVVQIQGILTKPLKAPQNTVLLSKTVWKAADPRLDLISPPTSSAHEVQDMAMDLERITYFYQRELHGAVSSGVCPVRDPAHQKFIDFIDYIVSSVSKSQHPHIPNEWTNDSKEQISRILNK
jgi:hybrid polyketide synthase/nonribosomal peptide synthetase ACE1